MTRSETPELQLLELLRSSDQPSAADRDRVRANIALHLTAGATVATTLVAAEHGSWLLHGGTIATWIKGATLATALVGAGVATTLYFAHKTPPPAVEAQSPAVNLRAVDVHEETLPANAEVLPQPESKSVTLEQTAGETAASSNVKRTVSPTKSPAYSGNASSLEAELVLIGQAQRALKASQPGDALRALEEHQRRFPAGVLSFERVGVRTVALCQSGRLDEGRTAARSYLRKVPNSVLSKRIRVACQMTDE